MWWASVEKRSLLSLLIFAHFTNDIYNFILPPLLVVMKYKFDISYFEGGMLVALYLLVSGLAQTPVARFSEKHGVQKQALLIGFLGMALTMVYFAFSSNFPDFLVGSLLLGLSLAPYHPQGIGAISVAFDSKERGSAVGLHQFGGNVGMFAAPLIVAALFSVVKLTWSEAMLVITIPALIAVIFIAALFQAPKQAISDEPKEKSNKWRLALLSPIILLALAYALNAVSTRAFSSFTPSYLDSVTSNLGLSEGLTSFVIASGMIAFPLGGYISDKLGRKSVIIVSYGLAGLFFLLYSLIGGVLALPLLFAAFFFGYIGSAPALAYASELGKNGRANSSVAVVFGAGTIGNAIGPFMVGPLIDFMGFIPAFRIMAIFAIMAAIPIILIEGHKRKALFSGEQA